MAVAVARAIAGVATFVVAFAIAGTVPLVFAAAFARAVVGAGVEAKVGVDPRAIAAWRSALDKLEEIPGKTLAGRTAQNQLDAYKRDFKEVVGLAAGNERVSALITAAQQFSWQGAKAGQNPPHTVTEWELVTLKISF